MAQRERWRRLPAASGGGTELLAGVEGMLAGLAETHRPAMRWSTLAGPTLFLGSSQRPGEVDLAAAAAAGVAVHKRRSGGTAVFADRQHLWLDVALPAGHRLLLPDITASYRWFGQVWAAALARVGIRARVVEPAEARELNAGLDPEVRRACFGGVSPYEVLAGNSKIVGLAQIRRRQGGLLQAGIYRHWEPERVAELLGGSTAEQQARTRLLRERAIGIEELAGTSVTLDDVCHAWEGALADDLGVELVEDGWTQAELAAAAAARERYAALTR
jgi:lipoate-protein ligase A